MIHFNHVSKRYAGGYQALSAVSLDLPKASMTFLTGHSGAGKSTLLKLIALIERPSQGSIIVNNINLATVNKRRLPYFRRHIGMVFQNHRLLYDRTVFDNVALPLVIAGLEHYDVARRVRAALDKVNLLGKERLNPLVLSAGEQQRVGIARAVVNKPPLLLADEPTGNLDPGLAVEIMRLFEQFSQVGVTVLVATHDAELIRRLPYRALILKQGRLLGLIDRSANSVTLHAES